MLRRRPLPRLLAQSSPTTPFLGYRRPRASSWALGRSSVARGSFPFSVPTFQPAASNASMYSSLSFSLLNLLLLPPIAVFFSELLELFGAQRRAPNVHIQTRQKLTRFVACKGHVGYQHMASPGLHPQLFL